MPYIPNRPLEERLNLPAFALLQVLEQLSPPQQGLLVALPTGAVLASSANARPYFPTDADQLPLTLGLVTGHSGEAALAELTENLKKHKQVEGQATSASNALPYTYTCRLVQYQEAEFICVSLEMKPEVVPQEHAGDDRSYQNVFDNNTEALFILDQQGNFIDVNSSALQLIEQEKSQLIGQSIFRHFDLNLFERVALRGQLEQSFKGESQKFEWWLHDKNQDLLPVEISLQKGNFNGQEVIFGSAKNLVTVVGTEQNVRFRNHQLEFVNQLITNIPVFENHQDVLKYTLDELLEKSDLGGGCIYSYEPMSSMARITYSVGEFKSIIASDELHLPTTLVHELEQNEKRRAVQELCELLERSLQHTISLVPILTDNNLIAVIVVWHRDGHKMSQSFVSLLDFLGTAIGNYIARHRLQQQLSYTEDKYKLLFEASYDAILLFRDGKVVDCNEKALEMFRCKREDLLSAAPDAFSPPIQPDGSLSSEKGEMLMQKILQDGEPITFEWRNKRLDGTFMDVEINLNRILIDGYPHVQSFKRDITQRKMAQQARRREEVMRESMEQFRSFLEKVNLIYYSLDRQGYITYANEFFLHYTEYTAEELIGQNFYDLLVPEYDRERRLSEFNKGLNTRQLESYYERDIVIKSGQVKTYRWNCMFEYDAEGEIVGITSVGKDMTDKRIAMEALKDNKIRLQDLFDNAHDLIQNISIDNKFIFVNRAWKERLGYSDFDIESLTLNDIVHPYYKAKLIYQLRNLYKGESVNKIETVFLTKAGKPVHLIGSINCSWQDGRPVATRAILHDITDRIKAERLQKVYYSIANLAISSKDLSSLYSAIHRELSKIIETRNIYIALCDNERQHLHFVYLIDQFIDKTTKSQIRRPFSVGLSEHIIRTGKPLYMQKQELIELSESQNVTIHGAIPEVILCSPLAIGDRIIGVITLQDYQNPDAYVHTDIEILHFISNQVALAIERKRNEEQINSQNAKLNAIFESGTQYMWSLNRDYELTSFNRNFSNMFTDRGSRELSMYSNVNEHLAALKGYNADFWRQKYDMVFRGEPQHFEINLHQPDNWREIYLNPIYLEDGSFEEISGIALDITDKKRSQLALSQSEEKFRHIFESFQDVYYRTDIDGMIELVSPSVKVLLGYRQEEVVGLNVSEFFVDKADLDRLTAHVLENKTIRNFEVDMVCQDGSIKSTLLDSRLAYGPDGRPVALEGVARDITELKRTQVELVNAKEEAENLLKVKTQFLANMSHELRTPMNGIIGMIDLLSQINTDAEQGEYIDTLRKSSDALLAILNDILDLSKMQAGKMAVSESGIDLRDTLGKIHSLFANRAQQKDLKFTYHISDSTPQYIVTDETRFLQILSNLTSNAIKFTNAGEVSIKVHTTHLKGIDYVLHVRVKDSGIGISPEGQAMLFTDFTQLDNSSTKTFSGTGLGLAISKQLTELLGGEIGVESSPDDGSTFWFNIRVKKANAKEVQAQMQRELLQNAEVEVLPYQAYVLLVDDNQINQKVAEKLLERLGCRTDIASNGFEAIALATANTYHMIFMDIQMPEMDGITATKHIKQKLGGNCPPIVAMTAYSMKDDAEKFMSQGMDDYVSKPIKSSDLHAVITKWEEESWFEEEALPAENSATPAPAVQEATATEAAPMVQTIIDYEIVEQLKQIGGDEFAKQLYVEFEEEAAVLLDEAKKALEEQHYNSILSTLHQLKGTGFTLGINSLAELAKQLEHDIKLDKLDSVDDNFSKLLEQYEHYRKAYKKIII